MQLLENLLLIAGLAVSLAGYAQLRQGARMLTGNYRKFIKAPALNHGTNH